MEIDKNKLLTVSAVEVMHSKTQQLTPVEFKETQAFLSSLFYLHSQAENSGLKSIAHIIERSIGNIEQWLQDKTIGDSDAISAVPDGTLFLYMRFFSMASKASREQLRQFCQYISTHEQEVCGAEIGA